MVKLRAKKLLALALSILMLTGTVTEWFPAALAAGEQASVTQQAAPPADTDAAPEAQAEGQTRETEGIPPRQLDFQDSDNGRPNLYVDFLGDNIGYGTAVNPGHLAAPANYNKDKRTNDIPENGWRGYSSDDVNGQTADSIIFWVGVGIDRTQVWELLKNGGNQGLTSLELGFYYNKTYIEPYVGADGYAATIERANFANITYNHSQWSDAYQLLHAETDLPVEDGSILRADPITQDVMANPSLDNIRANKYSDADESSALAAEWRMTYVSLELKDLESLAGRRLPGAYDPPTDGEGNPTVVPEASGTDNPPTYLLMIPFVVHRYDGNARLCLRLIRDASHFSIGAGNDGVGDGSTGSYAAWERVTTRNEGKDLKLQLRFAGDLNIWNTSEARVPDVFHRATLLIQNGGGSQNTARLSVQGDPGTTPVFVDQNNHFISNLQGGTGMRLDVTVQSGYVATVWVYYTGTETGADNTPVQIGWPFESFTDADNKSHYTFVMPNEDTFVQVIFQPGNLRDFTLYLSEKPKPYTEGYMLGNETTVSSMLNYAPVDSGDPDDLRPVSITSFDPQESHPNDGHGDGPKMMVSNDQDVTVTVSTHPDYEARVRFYNFSSEKNIGELVEPLPTDLERDPVDNSIFILPFGGTLIFKMPQSDVDVVVEYVKVTTRTAKLEVWHTGNAYDSQYVKDINIAQLAYLSYDEETAVTTAYSGQVYEAVDPDDPEEASKRKHSEVHSPSYKTAWVPYSFATVSNSLGGDTGRTGRIWSDPGADGVNSLMAALSNASSESNLATRFSALDLLGADLLGNERYMGLRKNLDGEVYGDGELAEAAALLWELRSKILADTAPGGLKDTYYAEGTVDTAKYNYFDLTPAQVQAYRIACLEVEGIFRTNRQEYRKAFQNYQKAKLIYDQVAQKGVTKDATPPIRPEEPLGAQLTAASGLREYQGKDYLDTYLVSYNAYMTRYTEYITELKKAETTPTEITYTGPLPTDRPERVEVPLLNAADAKTAVENAIATYKWDDREVKDPDNHVETTAAVSTRSGRTVWLLVEADSAYEVASVEMLNTSGEALKDTDGVALEARASTSFKNVYTFSMPQEDCIIRVNYKLRDQRRLLWMVTGADGEEENVAHIEAYQVTTLTQAPDPAPDPDWKNVYPPDIRVDRDDPTSDIVTPGVTRPTLARRTNEGHVDEKDYPAEDQYEKDSFPVEGVLSKSQVTVRLTCDKDYRVTVTATKGKGGPNITVTGNATTGLYTFTVPILDHDADQAPVVLTIAYAKKSQAPHRARIIVEHYDQKNYSAENTGLWIPEKRSDVTRQSGTALEGEISLAPGYYIYTSYAIGKSGSYPYTLDGNGYNNGAGAGLVSQGAQRSVVQLKTEMPDEDLDVYIIVRKGLPPEEPANALTVIVLDDENTVNPVADNWAKATVYAREDNAKRAELPAVGRGATGGGEPLMTTYDRGDVAAGTAILAGDRVELDLSAARGQGYYVAEVGLEPSHLGGDLEWLPVDSIASGERKFQFTMPAGSTTVTVRFRKLTGTDLLPSYYIHAMKIETDRDGNVVTSLDMDPKAENNNIITKATSETIRSFAGENGYHLDNKTNPEQVPSSASGRGAGVAGERVTMTFQVKPGWYVQSVAIMTDGSAHPAEDFDGSAPENDGRGGTFTADLVMPSGDAWFIVKYRQCPEDPNNPGGFLPRPEVPEYALTLMVIDNDNVVKPRADNIVTASFSGDEGMTHAPIQASVKNEETATTATAIQYIHAGDRVELSRSLAPGYSIDYIIVNPTSQGIVPTYIDPNTSEFTMPDRNITVIAKIVKRAPQQYTADLILRPPAGMSVADLVSVGQGTFVNTGSTTPDGTGGSLTDYFANAVYSRLLTPGERVDFDLHAFDGYYIRKVTVEPAVGTTSSLNGSFGYQSGGFVMPAANVHVNVYFEKLWPDEVRYDLTLKVLDASSRENNYAYFATVGGVDFPAADQKKVHGGESYTVSAAALDGEEVCVTLNRETDFYYSPSTIRVTDSSGAEIAWRMTATGIAFRMPPRSTTVEIAFHRDNRTVAEDPYRRAYLYIDGDEDPGDIVRLYRNDGTGAGDWATSSGSYISNLRSGDLLHLQVELAEDTKSTRWVKAAFAVDTATGEQLLLPITQVPDGGLSSFPVPTLPEGADPNEPIHVYVSLATKAEGDVDQTMTLVVRGPNGSGTATMAETDPPGDSVTATAGATGSTPPNAAVGTIRAAQGNGITVTMDPKEGYFISQLTVTDRQGNRVSYDWISMTENDDVDPSVWEPNDDPQRQQITLTVPATGGTVEVVYASIPTDPDHPDQPIEYTAQVVVNNDAYTGTGPSTNNATLSNKVLDQLAKKLVKAEAGQWVDLDITVQAGYRILPIFVSPQTFGIKPQLYLGDLKSQTTGFLMPAGDVTVYVTFVPDGLDVYNAMLVVEGFRGTVDTGTGLGSNHASIHSDRTGDRGPIDSSKVSVSVQAAEREWVTVKYVWDAEDSWVSSVTVKDQAGRRVPFTQVDENTIKVFMVPRDIVITVTYEDNGETPPPTPPDPDGPDPDPTPELTPVRLHVIDMSEDGSINTLDLGWAQVIHNGTGAPYQEPPFQDIPGDSSTNEVRNTAKLEPWVLTDGATYGQTDASWGHTETIWVPAGRNVTLRAFSALDQGVYIHSAYVLYRDGGQMIECNLKPNNKEADPNHDPNTDPGFYWDREATFAAHPDYNDVYVFLEKRTEPPVENEFAATLMLKSPDGDTGSAAAIWTTQDNKATVKANGDHGRIIAKRKDKVTVTVTPAEGYAIDYILMTPLGVPITPQRMGNSYTFTMPGYNVSMCVYLKRSNEREFDVTVHYISVKDLPAEAASHNKAKVSWSPDGSAPESREATYLAQDSLSMKVQENATVTVDVTLDAPFGVQAAYVLQGGALVPMSPALEGTLETVSQDDNSKADGTATFTMPSGDVDVFVAFTDDPPPPDWHTIVLVASDTAPAVNNSGKNRGFLNEADAPDEDKRIAFSKDAYFRMNTKPEATASQDPTLDPPWNPPSYFAHTFITLPEEKDDGSANYYTVVAKPDASYKFNPNKSVLTKNNPVYVQAINPITIIGADYYYREPVGDCNRAVHLVFESTDDLKLTVEIKDPDNPGTPGKGMVENIVKTSTPGLETLELVSDSALGSYQIMSGLTASATVDFVATPHDGYSAMAVLKAGTGADATVTHLVLTPAVADGKNVLNGSFAMPANDCTLTVTFFRPYEGTLVLRDLSGGGGHSAKMTESTGTPPDTVNVSSLTIDRGTLEDLPNGTALAAQMVNFDKTGREKVTALLTRNGSTTLLSPKAVEGSADDEYRHTIDRSDAVITLVVTDRNPDHPEDDPYIAAVETVNKPAGAADPTIANTKDTTAAKGSIWTAAHQNDTIQVHVTVPAGYTVDVRAKQADGTAVTIDPTDLTADGDADFTMPANHVQVTVTYRRVDFTLTLRVVSPDGNTTAVTPNAVASGTSPLTADGQTAVVTAGTNVDVSATPAADAFIRSITVQPAEGGDPYLVKTPMGVGAAYAGNFGMPQADTVVTVVYGAPQDPENPKPDYYLAYSAVEYDSGVPADPANRVVATRNITRDTLPGGSPAWAAGYAEDSVTVFYETAPGYYVTATAKRNDTDAPIPVVLLDHGTGGSATAAFPKEPSGDITITIQYHDASEKPEETPQPVALQLVGHKGDAANNAQTTGGTLSGLALDGTSLGRPPVYDVNEPFPPVEEVKSAAITGVDQLRTLAHWAANGHVVRMTVAVRNTGTNEETGEVDLLINRYGGSATSQVVMPAVGDNEIAVIRVYYGSIYTATLHIEPHGAYNENVNGNQTSSTDGRATIDHHLSRLENLAGGEEITTTAQPGPGQRLIGVVWESATRGAVSARPKNEDPANKKYATDHKYKFDMPGENVNIYAAYESENDRSYIAKVEFDGTDHLGDGGNAVTITNQSDAAAVHGTYWTAAKAGESVVVNVKVARGYKAEIITTHEDAKDGQTGHDGAHHDFYISRTAFVPNLTLGRDAVFSMPADTDATVTVRFTKGYDLSLEVVDASSGLADPANLNAADINNGTLRGESDGTSVTYTPAERVETDGSGTQRAVLHGVDPGTTTTISTSVTAATKDGKTAKYGVYRSSLFDGGTVRVNDPYTYPMPSADVAESVVFFSEDAPLLAKVEVKGEFDVNGNSATPIVDRTDTVNTTQGTVWTTTKGGNEIKLRITVAKGYEAKIKVRRDNEEYYLHPNDESQWKWLDANENGFKQGVTKWDDTATPAEKYDEKLFTEDSGVWEVPMGFQQYPLPRPFSDNIGGEEFFIFTMPTQDYDGGEATDVTVIVNFEFAGNIPQPFDPRNVKDDDYDHKPAFLETGFIYGQNRGDFAVVEIPTLIQKLEDNAELFHTHNHTPVGETEETKNDVEFDFFLYDAAANSYTPLLLGTDVLLEPYDSEDPDYDPTRDPYNYYGGDKALWTGPNHWHDQTDPNPVQFTGSKFKLIPVEPEDGSGRTDGAQALYEMLQSDDGSLDQTAGGAYYTRLAVIARDAVGQKSAYTQVWIRPYFTVQVQVISYAPNHTTTASLYRHKGEEAPDKTAEPMLTDETLYTGRVLGGNKYYQTLNLKSSELLGDFGSGYDPAKDLLDPANVDVTRAEAGDFTYAMTLEKASCLTYTRVKLDLWADKARYDSATRTYAISDIVYLITGDVDGDRRTKWQDYNMVYSYVWRGMPWNNSVTEAPDPSDPSYPTLSVDWQNSVYNPDSMAYRCDLNGDGRITVQDLNLVQTVFDYNRTEEDYRWKKVDTATGTVLENVLPFGFGGEKSDYNVTLFALWADDGEPVPVEPDAYWDSLVDPDATGAPPLDNPWVDENGVLWAAWEERPEDSRGSGEKNSGHRKDGEVMEVPEGEEAMDWPVYLPDDFFDLPLYDPVDLPLTDDNGPGEDRPETPADTTIEE